MTALDDAIETGGTAVAESCIGNDRSYPCAWCFDDGMCGDSTSRAIRAAVESGHLIARDDRDGLLAALGAEQVGMYNNYNKVHERNDGCALRDCVPVYTINPKEPQ